MKLFSFSIHLLLLAVSAWSGPLEDYKKTYEENLHKLDKPFAEWDDRYKAELKRVGAEARKDGNLDLYLGLKREIDAVGGVLPDVPKGIPVLLKMRSIYESKIQTLQKKNNSAHRQLLAAYEQRLSQLQRKLTQQDDIDAALAVRNVLEPIRRQLETLAIHPNPIRKRFPAATPIHPSVARTAGKLVAWGNIYGDKPVPLPEDHEKLLFIDVDTSWGGYLAITDKGKVHGSFKYKPTLKDVVQVQCGQHGYFALEADGDLHNLSPYPSHRVPKELLKLDNIASVEYGNDFGALLLKDGTVRPVGPRFRDRFPGPEEMLTNVSRISAGKNFYVLKRNGDLLGINPDGSLLEDPPRVKDIVDMQSEDANGCVMLTRQGEIVIWREGNHNGYDKLTIPSDVKKKALQIRVCGDWVAAQREDRTWVVFRAAGRGEDGIKAMNEELKRLGPLKDFELGNGWFVGIK